MIHKFSPEEYKRQLATSDSIQNCPKVPLPQIDENQNYIFISYSHKDYKKVYADLADMYKAGVRFWYDKGLSAGKKWEEEVREKILNANCVGVIFFMSKELFLSKSANIEIQLVHNLTSGKEKNISSIINCFSVNLTDKKPIQILSETMRDAVTDTLDMNMVSVLCQAFPDNATYLHYDAPDHTSELISQIQNQFGVIYNPENNTTIVKDTSPCSVFIGTFDYETLGQRRNLIHRLCDALEKVSITPYVMQEHKEGYVNDDLKNYIEQQNAAKLETAQCLIIICGVASFSIYFDMIEQLSTSSVSFPLETFYLIASEDYGDKEELFLSWFGNRLAEEKNKDIFEKVFFDQNSEQKLMDAIMNATK